MRFLAPPIEALDVVAWQDKISNTIPTDGIRAQIGSDSEAKMGAADCLADKWRVPTLPNEPQRLPTLPGTISPLHISAESLTERIDSLSASALRQPKRVRENRDLLVAAVRST